MFNNKMARKVTVAAPKKVVAKKIKHEFLLDKLKDYKYILLDVMMYVEY